MKLENTPPFDVIARPALGLYAATISAQGGLKLKATYRL
jgi:hypothetical protein